MANDVVIVVKSRDEASAVLDRIKGKAGGLGSALGGVLATGAAAGGAAVAAFGVKSVMAAMDFEHAVDQIGAVANATEAEMKGLSDKALQLGKDTMFGATEAAGAMEILAANGVSARDIMDGAADAAVALAAAGGTTLAIAADVASTSMAVWGLKTAQMTDVVNRLAGAANVSRFGVEDMAQAVAQGGGAAATAGVEFGDFATSIAAIAPSFSSGSDAGTSFKTFLVGLGGTSDSAKAKMIELGLYTEDAGNRFFDASGNMKSMADVTQILHDATAGLSEQQKIEALQTIFGTDAMRAAAGMAALTGAEFQKMSDTMGSTDAAAVAAVRMDNFKGSLDQLKGSIEVIMIQVGLALIPVLTKLADWLAEKLPVAIEAVVTKFKEWQPFIEQEIMPLIAELSAYIQEQWALFQVYYEQEIRPALKNVMTAVAEVVEFVREHWAEFEPIIRVPLDLALARIEHFQRTVFAILDIIIQLLQGDFSGAWKAVKELIDAQVDLIIGTLTIFKDAAIGLLKLVGEQIIIGLRDGAQSMLGYLVLFFTGLPGQIVGWIPNPLDILRDIGKKIIEGLIKGIESKLEDLKNVLGGIKNKIVGWKGPPSEDAVLLVENGQLIMQGLIDGLLSKQAALKQSLHEMALILGGLGGNAAAALQMTPFLDSLFTQLDEVDQQIRDYYASLPPYEGPGVVMPGTGEGTTGGGINPPVTGPGQKPTAPGADPISGTILGTRWAQSIALAIGSTATKVREMNVGEVIGKLNRIGSETELAKLTSMARNSSVWVNFMKALRGEGLSFDQGGWLPTGVSLAVNNTGRPERILGPQESGGGITVVINNTGPTTERQFLEWIDRGLRGRQWAR